MQRFFIPFFSLLILITQGCQVTENITKTRLPPTKTPTKIPVKNTQIFSVFEEGMKNQLLSRTEQLNKCNSLKLGYQNDPHWQAAWLLAYTLNDDYSCISQKETIKLLNKIQTMKGLSPQLLWLNSKHIEFHSKLEQFNKIQAQLVKTKNQKISLENELKLTITELEQVNSKIQALKDIETNINKKLDEENANR